jgi:hypothetical protein
VSGHRRYRRARQEHLSIRQSKQDHPM